ncbi:hypothetical protein NEPAR04_0595 [Nematocida parisii]|nr:hypothetical protein NEPAR03_0264 [Nematocida parisii]KAI5126746.1 hypothetical protein NEPAR08_0598 [Nematocida parisii]KAI5140934.1 hypothetical protein NEPAR04_0595 [Nematocida parisii]
MEVKIINTRKRQAAVASCLGMVSIIMFFIDISCISETMKTILSIELAILAVTIWANNPKSSKRMIPIATAISLHLFVYIGRYVLSSFFAVGSPEPYLVENLIKEFQNTENRVELITPKPELELELKSEVAPETESSGFKLKYLNHMMPSHPTIDDIVSFVIDEIRRRKIADEEEELKMQECQKYNNNKKESSMQEDKTENDEKSNSEGKIAYDKDKPLLFIDSSAVSSNDTHEHHNTKSKENEKMPDLKQGDSNILSDIIYKPLYDKPYDSHLNEDIIYTSPPPKEYIDRWNLCMIHQLPHKHYLSNGSVCATYGMAHNKTYGIYLKPASKDDIAPPIKIKNSYIPIIHKNDERSVPVDSINHRKPALSEEFESFLRSQGLTEMLFSSNGTNKDVKKYDKCEIETFHSILKYARDFFSIENPKNKKRILDLTDKVNKLEEIINRHKNTTNEKRSLNTCTKASKMSIVSENPSRNPVSMQSSHSTKSKK